MSVRSSAVLAALLFAGPAVQHLLGHAKLTATQVYLHVAGSTGLRVQSPLDRL